MTMDAMTFAPNGVQKILETDRNPSVESLPASASTLETFRKQFAEAREKIDYPIATPLLQAAWKSFQQLDASTQQGLSAELERVTEHRVLAETGFGLPDKDPLRRDKILTDGIDLYLELPPETQERLKPLMQPAVYGRKDELAASLGEDITHLGIDSHVGRMADGRVNTPLEIARGVAELADYNPDKYEREVYANSVDRELAQAEHNAFHLGYLHPYAAKQPYESSETKTNLDRASAFAEKGAIDISAETTRIERLHRGPSSPMDQIQYLQEFPAYEAMANLAPTMEVRYPQVDPGIAARVRSEHGVRTADL